MPLSDEDRETLVAFLDGELDEKTAQEIEAKINIDPAYRAEAEALKQAWGMLDFLPKAEPSTQFTHKTLQQVAINRQRETATMVLPTGKTGRALAMAALVLVALGLGWWMAGWLDSSQKNFSPDDPLVKHIRVIEKLPWYENIPDFEFLKKLDHPDLFGDD